MGRFDGRVAIVTGAGSGLGRATARLFADEGAPVACLDIAADAAEKTAADIAEHGGVARAYRVDVSDPDSVKDAVAAAWKDLGHPRIVVNCAGIGRFAHTHELPFEDWQKIIGVNLTGTFLVSQAALPHLLEGGGVIINIASNAGIKSQPYSAAYCASKAGVVHLTRCLADEYLKRNIRVNCVAPGGIETPLQEAFMDFPEGVSWKDLRKVMTPLGNSTPEEIAKVIAFIASDDCRYMTGSIVSIDGGLTVSMAVPMLDGARSLWELIEQRAAATPDRVMLHDGDRRTTFAEYQAMVERAAAGLHALGVGADDHVSWQLPTWTESAVLVGALGRLGAIQNPMLPIYRYREVAFIAKQTGCKLLITPSVWNNFDYAALAEQVAGENDGMHALVADHWNPDGDPASLPPAPAVFDDRAKDPVRWIFYTSGTTAAPKGAQHTDRSALHGAIAYLEKTHVVADDIALVAFPFTHIGGIIIGVFTPLLTGSAAVLMEAWTPQASTTLIRQHQITLANGAAAIHTALIEEAKADPDAYSTVRDFPGGGSTKPPHLHDELKRVVPSSIGTTSGYGMTEAPIVAQTDIDAPDSSKALAEGTPTRGVDMRILDSGEIVVKGPQVMRGYVDSSLDADAFTADAYLRTGDMGRFDETGAIVITGRIKDVIIRKGENVSAKEVEDVLYAHPLVADVAVLGIPDEDRGEMVVAFCVAKDPSDPPTLQNVREHCKAVGLMTQKIPERIEIIDVMPRNPSGKVPKHERRATIVD